SYTDRKKIAADMRTIYTAPSVEAAEIALKDLDQQWGGQYPGVIDVWRRAWNEAMRAALRSRRPPMPAAARQVLQRGDPAGLIPSAPADHRRPRGPGPPRDLGVGQPVGGQQHDPRPLRHPGPHRARPRQ